MGPDMWRANSCSRAQHGHARSPAARLLASGRVAIVVLEQPAELLLAPNLGKRNHPARQLLPSRLSFRDQQFVVLSLVWPEPVVIVNEHVAKVVQVALAKDDKVVEQFLPQRLVKTLAVLAILALVGVFSLVGLFF